MSMCCSSWASRRSESSRTCSTARLWIRRYKKLASYYAESMYAGGKWVLAAIDALGGRVEDRTKLLEALRAAQPTGLPRGVVTLDEYGSPIQSIYIRRVERVNGELQNTV